MNKQEKNKAIAEVDKAIDAMNILAETRYYMSISEILEKLGVLKNELILETEPDEVNMEEEAKKHNYMLLSRLRQDCDYYLGYGNRCDKHLWANNPVAQIEKMKELYNKLPAKPLWLTMEQIEEYEKQMTKEVSK